MKTEEKQQFGALITEIRDTWSNYIKIPSEASSLDHPQHKEWWQAIGDSADAVDDLELHIEEMLKNRLEIALGCLEGKLQSDEAKELAKELITEELQSIEQRKSDLNLWKKLRVEKVV